MLELYAVHRKWGLLRGSHLLRIYKDYDKHDHDNGLAGHMSHGHCPSDFFSHPQDTRGPEVTVPSHLGPAAPGGRTLCLNQL